LSILKSSVYQTASEKNRIINVPLYSTRGLILEADGSLIVENITSHKLTLIPEKTQNFDIVIEDIVKKLDISEIDLSNFQKSLKNRSYKYQPITLARSLTDEQVALYSSNKQNWPSINLKADLVRNVIDGPLFSHVIGYLGEVTLENNNASDLFQYKTDSLVGKAGIEKVYEKSLRGSKGYRTIEVDVHGAPVRVLEVDPPLKAEDITLSLDGSLQRVARESMLGKSGAVIAMDPRTGLIKALVSFPDYDPAIFNKRKINLLKQIIKDKKSPLFNRAVSGNYPPASTIKPFLGIYGLNKKAINWKTEINDEGTFQVNEGGRIFKGWKEEGHGLVNLSKAIIESSDVYFYNLALKLKIKDIANFLKSMGFGKRTGIDLDNEQTGVVPDSKWKLGNIGNSWYAGDTINLGIGQGYLTSTPIQLAVATSALANKGVTFKPRIVQKIGNKLTNQELLYKISTKEINWKNMENSLLSVIESWNGTAHNIFVSGEYRIAGKTGTAQTSSLLAEEEYSIVRKESSRRDHALFIGYGPVPNPKLVIVVVVEYGESGSAVAAPIAKKLFDTYLSKI